MNGWPAGCRLLAGLLVRLVPARTADGVIRDLHEAHRRRTDRTTAAAADRWLARQLLATLRPRRLRELRAVGTPALRDLDAGPLVRTGRTLAALAGDLRQGARALRARSGQAALTIVVLAGGLAVSIFTFSFLHAAVNRPLPLPDGDRVVRIMAVEAGRTNLLDGHDLQRMRENGLASFDVVGVYETRHLLVRGTEETRPLYGTVVEPSMFELAPTAPLLGRRLTASDAAPGAAPVAVLSHRVWRNTFGADPDVVGRPVEMNGVSTTIVGVMPEEFGFPVFGLLWLPLDEQERVATARGEVYPDAYARLREGVTPERANAELAAAIGALRAADPDPDAAYPDTAVVRTFQKAQLGDEADLVAFTLHLAAGFILLLACVNAGNLLLARGLERTREIRVRMALGAPRLRLVLQMMAEGAVITAIAAALGVLGAARALSLFDERAHAALPEGLAYWWRWGMDGPTLAAAAVLAFGTLLLVGGLPAWSVTRLDAAHALRDDDRPGQGGGRARLAGVVVVMQIAVIAVLLYLGGVATLVARRAADVDLGIETERVVLGNVALPAERYASADGRRDFYERLAGELTASPAVESVLLRSQVGGGPVPVEVDGVEYESEEQRPRATVRTEMGNPDTIGLRLLAGRHFAPADDAAGPPVAMVSAALARELWGDVSPLGRRLRVPAEVGDAGTAPLREVVGVMSDILEGNPVGRDRNHATVYVPMRQVTPARVAVAFAHRGDVRAAISALHESLAALDPLVFPERVENFDDLLGTMQTLSRTALQVLTACFAFALLLAVAGIYGLTSRAVTVRIPELGVRRALGATDRRIVALLLASSGRQLAVGLGIASVAGFLMGLAVSRFVDLDPLLWGATAGAVPLLIAAIVFTATYLPTRRAIVLSPREAIWRD